MENKTPGPDRERSGVFVIVYLRVKMYLGGKKYSMPKSEGSHEEKMREWAVVSK